MNDILTKIGQIGLVPVVKIEDEKYAVELGRALLEGGLPVAEITFRTPAAKESIRRISAELPDILVGAGTVLTIEQAKSAVLAGAKYIVSPGFNPEIVKYCLDQGVAITPGCSNPTDIEKALGFGLDVVKFFPAEAFGGLKTLKALSAPYDMVKFMPTGGISPSNLNEYLAFGKVLACGGSWMVKDELIKAGNFAEIKRLTSEAVKSMLGFELAKIEIRSGDESKAALATGKFACIFNAAVEDHSNGSNDPGKNGEILIKTNSITRAAAYLKRNKMFIKETAANTKTDVSTESVYLAEEINGFSIRLMQK